MTPSHPRRPSKRDPRTGHRRSTRAEGDLGRAELVQTAGFQDAVVVGGVAALVALPIAWALTQLQRLVRRADRT